MLEIENEESENRGTPPPTALTTERILFIFGLNTSRRNRLRGTEAIFEFHSWTWDIAQKVPFLDSLQKKHEIVIFYGSG